MLFSPGFAGVNKDLAKLHMTARSVAANSIKRHKSMLQQGGDKFGIFRFREDVASSGNQDEQRLSLAITSGFDEYITSVLSVLGNPGIIFGAREQYDNCKNSQDYVINRVFPDGTIQAAVIEFANDSGLKRDRKESQLFTYIKNDSHSLPREKSTLIIGVSFVQLKTHTPSFQVFGYYQKEGVIFHVVPLTMELELTIANFANLLYATIAFAIMLDAEKLPSIHGGMNDLRFPEGTGGICQLGTFRVKVINYLNFHPLRIENGGRGSIPQEERRTCKWYLEILKESLHLAVGYGLDIIVYPNIVGNHDPSHTECIAACITHLAEAHAQGIIHSDLHLGNFIFNAQHPERSCIIDWDHARHKSNPGIYVPGWQKLPERHPLALPRCPVQIEHDRYSLMQVLRRFLPTEVRDKPIWEKMCEDPRNLVCALQQLAASVLSLNMPLFLLESSVTTTGSPPRGATPASTRIPPIEEELHHLCVSK